MVRGRGQEGVDPDIKTKFESFRVKLVAVYILSNFLVCMLVLDSTFQGKYRSGDPYWRKI